MSTPRIQEQRPVREMNSIMESPDSLQPAERSSTITKCPSLPAEIWRLIFSVGEFDGHGSFWSTYDHPTMANICRSCTLFRDLVRPRLYCNFESHVFTDEWHLFSVAKFAWTICTNPHLASLVRHVNIRGVCDMFPEPRVTATDDHDHPMASVLINKAAELGMEFKYYEVYTNRHGGNVGFDLVALALAQLPMMDTLNLAWFDTHTIARMPEPRGGWPWTQSLKNMHLKPCSTADPTNSRQPSSASPRYSLSRVLPLLRSGRALERLLFFGSSGPYLALPLENLLEVNLINCHFVESELRNLLHNCRRLRKFVCTGGAAACEVIQDLEPAYSSLEVLGMDLRRWAGPWGVRIPSLKQFIALKVLYIDLVCVWDWLAANNTDSPPSPDMLFTTLLPESIEEVALFGMGSNAEAYGFEVEAHVKRLASDRKEKGRFQQLKQLRGQGFWPFGYDVDPRSVANDDIVPRITALNDAKAVLGDNGVEVIFDVEGDSDLEFGNIMSFC